MGTYQKIITALALAAIVTTGSQVSAQTTVTTDIAVDVTTSNSDQPQKAQTARKPLQNIQQNRDVRNDLIEQRRDIQQDRRDVHASTTADLKVLQGERRDMMKNASTSAMKREAVLRFKDDKGALLAKAKKEDVTLRQTKIAAELKARLAIITNLRTRIDMVLTKLETNGKDTVDARAALKIADEKIATAKTAIQTIVAWKPSEIASTTATVSANIDVSLSKPREIAGTAIKAIKEAGEALRKVISTIGKFEKENKPRVEVHSEGHSSTTVEAN